jgi:mono/diheme cytochrome c family protein
MGMTTEDAVNSLLSGKTYVEVHTNTHLGGEIRGQIVPFLPLGPTLASIFANIFSPHCAYCHSPGNAGDGAVGVDLSSPEASFNTLVNIKAVPPSTLMRVDPDHPELSYLINKLTGNGMASGSRMPYDGPPYLSDQQIQTISDWITNGAQNN